MSKLLVKHDSCLWDSSAAIVFARDGGRIIVDKDDYWRLARYPWSLTRSESCLYATTRMVVNGKWKDVKMHRLVLSCSPDMVVHHINGDTLDNRKSNLQMMTKKEHDRL